MNGGGDEGGGPTEYYPVLLDLNGDGLHLLSVENSPMWLDVNGDGVAEHVSWFSGPDGVLVLDRDGDGLVSNASEMSFVGDLFGADSDMAGLLAFDTNWDGALTAEDERFGDFRVWVDHNGDGISGASEMFSLSDLGIQSIGLERQGYSDYDPEGADAQVLAYSAALMGSTTIRAYDVAFGFD